MRASTILPSLSAALASLFLATGASATVIGDLKTTSGSGATTISLNSFTLSPDTSSNPAGPPWNAQVTITTTLSFAGCSGVLGSPGCLDSGAFSPAEGVEIANNNTLPLNGSLSGNNPFIQFAGNGIAHATVLYSIQTLGAGSANTNCAALVNFGDSCSPVAGSPMVLTLTPTGTSVSLAFTGTVTDGSGVSNWIGQYATPIAGMTPGQVQSTLLAGGSITKPSSGDFLASSVPEPGTIGLTMIGGALIAFASARKRRRK